MENWENEWYLMELIPSHSIPFHTFFTKPNNRMLNHPIPFQSIPSFSTNPNIALDNMVYEKVPHKQIKKKPRFLDDRLCR